MQIKAEEDLVNSLCNYHVTDDSMFKVILGLKTGKNKIIKTLLKDDTRGLFRVNRM